MDKSRAGARRSGAFPELFAACGAPEPRRAPHHAVLQCHPSAAEFLGVRDQVRRLNNARNRLRHWPALLLMMASGFAGLGYQIVWTQQCSSWLGHESAAVL